MTPSPHTPEKLKISCPGCGQKLDVTGIAAFAEIRCPKCQCEIKVPRRFAHFLLEDVIEHGHIASVYRALDMKLDREVAVKIFDADIGENPNTVKIFQEIIRSSAGLNHPNIIPIYSSGDHEGHPYLTMEYMDQTGLRQKIATDGAAGVKEALDIIENTARGLDAARNEGVEHGGLHPRNILIDSENGIKISDFQMHRLTGKSTIEKGTEGTIRRTDPRYASPELLTRGEQDYRGDIYSLGVILGFMLMGNHPFHAEVPYKERNITWEEIEKDPARTIPKKVKALVASMTTAIVSERPQSYRKIITEIEEVRDSLEQNKHGKTVSIMAARGIRDQKANGQTGERLKERIKQVHRAKSIRRIVAIIVLIVLATGCWTLLKASKERPKWYEEHIAPIVHKVRAVFSLTPSGYPTTPHDEEPTPSPGEPQNTIVHADNGAAGDEETIAPPPPPITDDPMTFDIHDEEKRLTPKPALADRPQPTDLNFFAIKEHLVEYVDQQPIEIREIEKDRVRKLSSIRDYVKTLMKYIPFEPEDGYIQLANGRRIRGSIPFCNDRELTIRLTRHRTKFSSVEWQDIDITQYQEILVFYAEKRLIASDAPQSLTVKISPTKDAANDYFLAAVLAEWYGHPNDAADYAQKALKLNPNLQNDIKRFFFYLLD